MDKRYQVFVSSTFQDLQDERQEVMHALLELDCIPSGMELFPAANETQWELIKRVIDDCDYYLLIIGGRYGTIGPDGISYTEMEYDYAISIGKPTVAFIHKEPDKIEAGKTEKSEEGQEKLKSFKEKIEKKLCKYWSSPAELGSVVSRSLIQLIKREPAIGWVRATELADKDATHELLKLRKKVDDLNTELATVRTTAPKGTEKLAQGDDKQVIRYTFRSRDPRTYKSISYEASFSRSWNEIFSYVSPLMIHEAANPQIESSLDTYCAEQTLDELNKNTKLKNKELLNFKIKAEDFQTIIVQLRALGLISKSVKNRSVKDTETYWKLTPYGDEVMTRLRAIKKENGKAEQKKDLELQENKE